MRISLRRHYHREWGYPAMFTLSQNLNSRIDRQTLGVWYVSLYIWRYALELTGRSRA